MSDQQSMPGTRGFIAVYRWEVDADHEAEFRRRWHELTLQGREFGALGSCLTRDANGQFIAIALWPSEQTRRAAFARIDIGPPWRGVKRLSEWALDVTEDLWLGSPFAAVDNGDRFSR